MMKRGITALVGLVSVLVLVLMLNLATEAGDGTPIACSQAGDGPPSGVNTPDTTVLIEWRTVVHELRLFYTPAPGGFGVQGGGEGEGYATPDVSGLTWADWLDPQPAEGLGAVTGGFSATIDVPCE